METCAQKSLNACGRFSRPEHRQVRFGGRPEIVERMENPERASGHQRPSVQAHAADRLGDPGRVAGEQLVVIGGAEKPDDPQLHDEMIDELLRLLLRRAYPSYEVAFDVDVEEGRDPADAHRRAVLLLDRARETRSRATAPLPGRSRRAARYRSRRLRPFRQFLRAP